MSNNSGPSAEQVANEVRRNQLSARLKVEKPELFKEYDTQYRFFQLIQFLVVLALFGVLWLAVNIESWGPIIIFILVISALSAVVPSGDKILDEFEDLMLRSNVSRNNTIDEVGKMISEDEAVIVGDQIIAHPGAIIVNRSVVVDSYNTVNQKDPELAHALSILAGFIEISKNKDAGEIFSGLATEISDEARPSIIRTFWNELVRILPGVAKLTSVVAKITTLIV